jgi:hypothetical protein
MVRFITLLTKLVSCVISFFGVLFCLDTRLLFVNNISYYLSNYNNSYTNVYNVWVKSGEV